MKRITLSVLLLIFGVALVTYGLKTKIESMIFFSNAKETDATITKIEYDYKDAHGNVFYNIYVTFSVDNIKYNGELDLYDSDMKVGDKEKIYYNLKDPNNFRSKSSEIIGIAILFFGLLAVGMAYETYKDDDNYDEDIKKLENKRNKKIVLLKDDKLSLPSMIVTLIMGISMFIYGIRNNGWDFFENIENFSFEFLFLVLGILFTSISLIFIINSGIINSTILKQIRSRALGYLFGIFFSFFGFIFSYITIFGSEKAMNIKNFYIPSIISIIFGILGITFIISNSFYKKKIITILVTKIEEKVNEIEGLNIIYLNKCNNNNFSQKKLIGKYIYITENNLFKVGEYYKININKYGTASSKYAEFYSILQVNGKMPIGTRPLNNYDIEDFTKVV